MDKRMADRKRKKYDHSVPALFYRAAPGSEFLSSLRRLIDAFFGNAQAYQPTTTEIVNYHLTPREREIIYLAALGFSDKEIADALALNFQTVRVHLRHALDKLNLEDARALQDYFWGGQVND